MKLLPFILILVHGILCPLFARPSKSIQFDGKTQYISIPTASDLLMGEEQHLTISLWIKVTTFKQGGRILSNRFEDKYRGYCIYTMPSGLSVLSSSIDQYSRKYHPFDLTLSSTHDALNEWVHLAIVHDRDLGQNKIYINGKLSYYNRNLEETHIYDSPLDIYIGAEVDRSSDTVGHYFKGSVANIRFYRDVLSSEEIRMDMNTNEFYGLPFAHTCIAAYSPDGKNLKSRLIDQTGRGNDGKLMGFSIRKKKNSLYTCKQLYENTNHAGLCFGLNLECLFPY